MRAASPRRCLDPCEERARRAGPPARAWGGLKTPAGCRPAVPVAGVKRGGPAPRQRAALIMSCSAREPQLAPRGGASPELLAFSGRSAVWGLRGCIAGSTSGSSRLRSAWPASSCCCCCSLTRRLACTRWVALRAASARSDGGEGWAHAHIGHRRAATSRLSCTCAARWGWAHAHASSSSYQAARAGHAKHLGIAKHAAHSEAVPHAADQGDGVPEQGDRDARAQHALRVAQHLQRQRRRLLGHQEVGPARVGLVFEGLGCRVQGPGVRGWGSGAGRSRQPATWPGAAAGCRQRRTAGCWAPASRSSRCPAPEAHQFTAKASTELSASSGRNPAPAAVQKGVPGCWICMQAPAGGAARVPRAAERWCPGTPAQCELWQAVPPGWRTLALPGQHRHRGKGAALPHGGRRQQHGHAEHAHVGQQAQAVQPLAVVQEQALRAGCRGEPEG